MQNGEGERHLADERCHVRGYRVIGRGEMYVKGESRCRGWNRSSAILVKARTVDK